MNQKVVNPKERIEELVRILNKASEAYYNGMDEIMSNYEWDAMFDELTVLEEETGHVLSNSPTQNAGYESTSGQKEAHEYSALSLAKTKKVEELERRHNEDLVYLQFAKSIKLLGRIPTPLKIGSVRFDDFLEYVHNPFQEQKHLYLY